MISYDKMALGGLVRAGSVRDVGMPDPVLLGKVPPALVRWSPLRDRGTLIVFMADLFRRECALSCKPFATSNVDETKILFVLTQHYALFPVP